MRVWGRERERECVGVRVSGVFNAAMSWALLASHITPPHLSTPHLPLPLRVHHPRQLGQEPLRRIHNRHGKVQLLLEHPPHALSLVQAQQAVVHKHAVQAVAKHLEEWGEGALVILIRCCLQTRSAGGRQGPAGDMGI